MGTRGIFGVVVDGEVKASYNHFDSYPDGLGESIVNQVAFMLKEWGAEKMIEQARKLVLVNQETKPTIKQVKELKSFTDLKVHNQSTDDWYCVIRELQGNLTDTLVVGLMIEGGVGFALDSLFCEWGYLVNVDDGTLEVYRGFQHSPHDKGRFALKDGDPEPEKADYEGAEAHYPIALIATFPLNNIPDDFAQMCSFNGLDLFINEDGKEYTVGDDAVREMKDGDTILGYNIYGDERELTTKLTRNGSGDYVFVNPEDEDEDE